MKNSKKIFLLALIIALLLHYVISNIPYIWYIINYIVTIFHEIWHWVWALITFWNFHKIDINIDGSWLATTSWWIRAIVLLWWFIWSLIFWNLLLKASLNIKDKDYISFFMWIIFSILAIFFSADIFSFIIIMFYAIIFFTLFKYNKYNKYIFSVLWFLVIFYVLLDFNVWPISDIWKFADIFIIIPSFVWMYIWLLLWLFITIFNIYYIFKKSN